MVDTKIETKIVFFDIDGTLIGWDATPSQKVIEAIHRLKANGHRAVLCTGRNRCMIDPAVLNIGFDGIICSAGSYIEYDNQIIDQTFIEHDKLLQIISLLQKHNILTNLEGTYASYYDDELVNALMLSPDIQCTSEIKKIHAELGKVDNRYTLTTFYKQIVPIHKISYMAQNMGDVRQLQQQIGKEYQVHVHEIFPGSVINGEIIPKKTHKGTAILTLLDYLHIPRKNSIAFGDSMNDYEMLQTVQYGVAMANGSKELQEIADASCPSVEKDGVYYGLQDLDLL